MGLTVMQTLYPAVLGKEHLFRADDGSKALVKRVQPLPRLTASTVLVDCSLSTYQLNPENTLLVRRFEDFDEDNDRTASVILAFTQLMHTMYKTRRARTASEVLAQLRSKYAAELAEDPYRMGDLILAETKALREETELLERSSLRAGMKSVAQDTIIGRGRAITANSTRLSTDAVPDNSILDKRIKEMKAFQERFQKAHREKMERQMRGDDEVNKH